MSVPITQQLFCHVQPGGQRATTCIAKVNLFSALLSRWSYLYFSNPLIGCPESKHLLIVPGRGWMAKFALMGLCSPWWAKTMTQTVSRRTGNGGKITNHICQSTLADALRLRPIPRPGQVGAVCYCIAAAGKVDDISFLPGLELYGELMRKVLSTRSKLREEEVLIDGFNRGQNGNYEVVVNVNFPIVCSNSLSIRRHP